MSLAALMIAVRDRLREQVPLSTAECLCMIDGQPPPNFGQRFVAVHSASWTQGPHPLASGIEESYAIDCTLTVRCPIQPRDRWNDELYLKVLSGMEVICRKIVLAVHDEWSVVNAANAIIGSANQGLVETLRWRGTDPAPVIRGNEWVFSDSVEETGPAALTMTVHFGEALRPQTADRAV